MIPEAFRGLFDDYRYKAFHGGRGTAKSHSFASALTILAAQKPLRIVCAREVQKSVRESVKELIENKIVENGLAHLWDPHEQETRLAGSKFIYMGMWRNRDAIKSLEGADIFWGEEAAAFSARSLRIIRPTIRKPGSQLWFSWNPEFDHDPVDAFFRGKNGPPPNSLVVKVTQDDNPFFAGTELQAEMDADYKNDPQTAEHTWGGGYLTVVEGAYFTAQLLKAKEEGRIGEVARDDLMRIRCAWDLGQTDSTAIWVYQIVGQRILVLDYLEGQSQPLSYYTAWLRENGYGSALCALPHDASHPDTIFSTKYEDALREAGFDVQVVKNQGKGAAMKRIEAVRRLFPRIWINQDTTRPGYKALAAYHERRDEKRNVGLGPEHDWASHGADAFGLMCIAYEEPTSSADEDHHGGVRGEGGWMN